MISLTRLNGKGLIVNVDLIKFIETTPDTVLTLLNGDKLPVAESADEIVSLVIAFKREIQQGPIQPGLADRALEF